MTQLLTHSRLKTARQCARLHLFKYVLGYQPVEDGAAVAFGALAHVGLEAWWRAAKDGVDKALWLGVAVFAVRAREGVDPFALALVEVLLAGYHQRWKDDADEYEVLGVEEQFDIALVNPATGGTSPVWRLAGKLDVRARRKSDGKTGIIEHKTSSEDIGPGSSYFARLALDGQISIYWDGGSSLGDPVEWCLYDVLGKPALRPYKATPEASRKFKANGELYANQRLEDETPADYQVRVAEAVGADPERYFRRGDVVRLEAELQEARAETWAQAGTLRENANADRHARNPDACAAYGRMCPFFGVCTGSDSLTNERLFVRLETAHPELAGYPTSEAGPKEEARP